MDAILRFDPASKNFAGNQFFSPDSRRGAVPSVGANGRRGQVKVQFSFGVKLISRKCWKIKRFLAARTRNQAALQIEFGGEP